MMGNRPRNLVASRLLCLAALLSACDVDSPDGEEARIAAVTGGTALLVVGGTALSSGDTAVSARLQALGLTVSVKTAATAKATDASGKRIVVISSTAAAGTVGSTFRSVAVPVLTWQPALLPAMGMTGSTPGTSFGTLTGQRNLVLVAGKTDPLTAGLAGTQTVVSSAKTFSWGVPASTAVAVANAATGTNHRAIFRYERGVAMVGLTAPERRTALFLSDTTAAALTGAGQMLVDAALRWTAHEESSGTACTAAADCTSGFCVDGVCCDSACAGSCSSCAQAGTVGTCTLLPAGTACSGAPTCAGGTLTAPVCNGVSTTCGTPVSCAPYQCTSSTACGTSCATDTDCAGGTHCNATGQCVPPSPNGAACTRSADCASAFCVDGVCCNSACTGLCSSCAQPGLLGACAPLPAGTACAGTPVCSGGVLLVPVCDGASSACGTQRSCAPFQCANSTACALSCTTDTDCQGGTHCSGGQCG